MNRWTGEQDKESLEESDANALTREWFYEKAKVQQSNDSKQKAEESQLKTILPHNQFRLDTNERSG